MRVWLCKAAAEVSMSSLQPPHHSFSTTLPSLASMLNRGYMNLLCWQPGQKEYPETLLMDQQDLQAQVNELTIIAAVLLVTRGMRSTLRSLPGFVSRLKRVTKVILKGTRVPEEKNEHKEALEDSDHVLQEVSRTPQLGYSAFTLTYTSPKGQIKSIADNDNTAQHIIGESLSLSILNLKPLCTCRPQFRFRLITLEHTGQEASCADCRFTFVCLLPLPTEQQIHCFLCLLISPDGQRQKDFLKSLGPVQEELWEAGSRFGSVIHHNRQEFGLHHSGILKKVLLPDAEPDSEVKHFLPQYLTSCLGL
ncbi:LOW QUALITY PROTEIN: T-complex protein 11 homolog [Guaruba guarouba]